MCFVVGREIDVRGRELTYMATYPRTDYICTSSFRISFSLHSDVASLACLSSHLIDFGRVQFTNEMLGGSNPYFYASTYIYPSYSYLSGH